MIDISDDKTAFIIDIKIYLDNIGSRWNDLSIQYFRDYFREEVNSHKKLYRNLVLPTPIVYLQMYDRDNGTDYATEAKSMFFGMANAVVKADGNISEKEATALSKYKELLSNFRLEDGIEENQNIESKNNISFGNENNIGVTQLKHC